jgi:hypothetical protein
VSELPPDPFKGGDDLLNAMNEGAALWAAIYEQPASKLVTAIEALSKDELRLIVYERVCREKQHPPKDV